MKPHKLAYAIFAIALFASCSEEKFPEVPAFDSGIGTQLTETEAKVLLSMRSDNNRVGIEEALEQANWVIGFLEGESALKSGSGRKVSSVSALISDKPVALKSGNFGDIGIHGQRLFDGFNGQPRRGYILGTPGRLHA
jgi:hypothetical protein